MLALALATVLVAVAGTAAAVVVSRRDTGDARAADPQAATMTSPVAPTTTGLAQPAVDALVADLQRFVEQARGLRFTAPVNVTLLDEEAFKGRVRSGQEAENADEIAKYNGLFRALRLIEPGVDLAAVSQQIAEEGVVGFYDPATDELVVRGVAPTPYVRQVLVHELVHALQDQHFDIDRPELDEIRDSEVGAGFEALVEGDAVRIDEAYRDSLPTEERIAAAREEKAESEGADVASLPDAVLALFGFPYAVGPDFVRAVVEARGQAGLDAAFASPPTTAEQLLHPEKYLAGERLRPVAVPRAEGEPFDDGIFGEPGFSLILGQLLSFERALVAADGWGGDRYVAWKQGDRVCVRVAVVTDTRDDGAELADALRRWAERHGAATVERQSPLTVKACE